MVGNAEYQCSCVRYVSQDNEALTVGLSVGLCLLFIIIVIVIIIIVLYRRRHSKPSGGEEVSADNDVVPMEQSNEDKYYSTQFPDDYVGYSPGESPL